MDSSPSVTRLNRNRIMIPPDSTQFSACPHLEPTGKIPRMVISNDKSSFEQLRWRVSGPGELAPFYVHYMRTDDYCRGRDDHH